MILVPPAGALGELGLDQAGRRRGHHLVPPPAGELGELGLDQARRHRGDRLVPPPAGELGLDQASHAAPRTRAAISASESASSSASLRSVSIEGWRFPFSRSLTNTREHPRRSAKSAWDRANPVRRAKRMLFLAATHQQ